MAVAKSAFADVKNITSNLKTANPAVVGEVDMLLCLAADVSESVTRPEYELQREGHAAAIEDEEVVAFIKKGLLGRVAVVYVEWADQLQQSLGVDWSVIDDQTSASAFANRIRRSPAPSWIASPVRNTSTSEAIRSCLKQFDNAPVKAARHIIDLSTDGTHNMGTEITVVRDEAVQRGATINVLAIIDMADSAHPFTHTRPKGGLVNYFETNVAGGAGAFVESANGWNSYGETLKRKFLLELAGLPLGHTAR